MKARIAASVVLAFGLALGSTGCTMITYQATTEEYDPSDGVSATVGSVDILNALLISNDGVDANLIATIVNTGTSTVQLNVQWGSGGNRSTETIPVERGSTVVLGSEESEPVLISDIDSIPGSLLPMFFQYGNETGQEIRVPVLTDELPEYKNLAP